MSPSLLWLLAGCLQALRPQYVAPVVAFLCLAGSVACIGQAALAGPAEWSAYFKLLDESRCGTTRCIGALVTLVGMVL